ncbi:MAG TPA: cysteine-rich CWC family protein [Chitinophagaceae bacterium]|nr:cysteine-rich CWC family protein [Chitinophagaceae bacterium]
MNKQKIKHEYKTCPRCGAGFECKAGSILQCQCYGIVLPPVVQQQIELDYRECLCRSCLEILRDQAMAYKPAE